MSEPRSPTALLELATAFQRSKVLFALVELGIPTLLAERPRSSTAIAERLDADPLATDRFLRTCLLLGLLVREQNLFRNAPDAEHFLVRGTPAYLGDALGRYDRVSRSAAWSGFARRLTAWRSGGHSERFSKESVAVGAEEDGEHRLALLAGEGLGRALDLSATQCLLDLGGGTAAMAIALCRRFAALRAIVLELPPIAPTALDYVRASGLGDRIEVRVGDFLTCALPSGCDVVLLANVSSMLSAETNRALVKRVFAHLPAGGRIVLSGWMLDDDGTGPLLPALFCLEDIVLGAPDVERTTTTYASWLADAGFADIESRRYFDPLEFVTGRKPR